MSLVVYDPFAEYGRLLAQYSAHAEETFCPPADVVETPESFDVSVELPGVAKDDLEVTLEDHVLRIVGNRKERKAVRRFALPEHIDESKTAAELKDGVLTVHVIKSPLPKPTIIEVKAA